MVLGCSHKFLVVLSGCRMFSVVMVLSGTCKWFSVVLTGSRMVLIGSQCSRRFSLVLSGFLRFSMFLSAFCWLS